MSPMLLALLIASCQDYEVHENEPDLEPSTRTIDFGEVVVGTRSDVGINLDNVGRGVLHVLDVTLDGTTSGDFSLLDMETDRVEPGKAVVLAVRYTPDMVGQDYGRVVLSTDDPEEPEVEIDLVGFGVEPRIDVDPETLWFGDVAMGEERTLSVEVSAVGTGTTRITEIALESDEDAFQLALPAGVEPPYALAAGFSFSFDVTFAPPRDEAFDTTLRIASNDPLEPVVAVRLLGNTDENPTENTAPTVEITDPDWGAYLVMDREVELRGSAVDVEDGPENLACMWYANGRLLGTAVPAEDGTVTLSTSALPEGTVVVTLTALDSEGEAGSDSVTVTVWDETEPMRYTISGGNTPYHYWTVDDDVTIEVDGTPVFSDTNHTQDAHPPVEFDAMVGSTIRVVATDYNYCQKQLDGLYLHFGTGLFTPLTDAVCGSACPADACYDGTYSGPWPSIFLDETVTVSIP